MKKDLVMGWVFIGLALLMVFCIVYGCFIGNWEALPMCSFALILDIVNAANRFNDYKRCKGYEASWSKLDLAIRECWPDEDEDELENNSIITD